MSRRHKRLEVSPAGLLEESVCVAGNPQSLRSGLDEPPWARAAGDAREEGGDPAGAEPASYDLRPSGSGLALQLPFLYFLHSVPY